MAINDKRYAHFDIVAKVAAVEIEGVDAALRYEDLKTTFESQASFSNRSNVAQRLKATFDYLDSVFPERSDLLRNRTLVQSLATLVARLVTTGKHDGRQDGLRRFFGNFMEQLSRQVTLGQQATDPDYLEFQKTVTTNVRRNAQIRNEILLRKMLLFDPSFADVFGVSGVAESAMEKSLSHSANRIQALIQSKNEEYASVHGVDLFKATNRTTGTLAQLGSAVRNYSQYRDWVDGLYFLFRESVGNRLERAWPLTFVDVNVLRTAERHDVDHGEPSKASAKRRKFGGVFKKYSGAATPETLAPEKFCVVQAKLLQALETELQNLKIP